MLDTHNYIYFGESHQKDNEEIESKKSESRMDQQQNVSRKKINFSVKKKKVEQKVEEWGRILILDDKSEWRDDNGGNKGPTSRTNYYSLYREPYLLIMGG